MKCEHKQVIDMKTLRKDLQSLKRKTKNYDLTNARSAFLEYHNSIDYKYGPSYNQEDEKVQRLEKVRSCERLETLFEYCPWDQKPVVKVKDKEYIVLNILGGYTLYHVETYSIDSLPDFFVSYGKDKKRLIETFSKNGAVKIYANRLTHLGYIRESSLWGKDFTD